MVIPLEVLAIAFIACLCLTPVVRRIALKTGFVDQPNARKLHLTPIPLLGGLAMYAATVVGVIFFLGGTAFAEIVGIFAGATLLVIVGLLDDRGKLHHQIKLMLAMPLAALLLVVSGIHVSFFGSLAALPGQPILGQLADAALTVLWVVGITAAFSILDHMDGLCAGVAGIACMFYLLLAMQGGQILVAILAAAVMGAALGFLRWNFKPAKIFMGDAGAMFLGFMLAALSLKLRPWAPANSAAWVAAVLVLGVPIFDTTLVFLSRTRRGLIPFASPGKDHTAHRLANLGLGQRNAVLALYGLGFACGLIALAIPQLMPLATYAIVGALVIAGLTAIVMLERVPYERQTAKAPQESHSAV